MTFLLANWRLVLLAALLGVIGVQTWRLDRSQKEFKQLETAFATFKAKVEVLGEQAKRQAAAKEAADKERKDKADAENAKTRAALDIALNSLRRSTADPRGRVLPAAPSGSVRPDLACFDRAEYQRADGEAAANLLSGARSLADEGTAATVDLDTAKRWAQTR